MANVKFKVLIVMANVKFKALIAAVVILVLAYFIGRWRLYKCSTEKFMRVLGIFSMVYILLSKFVGPAIGEIFPGGADLDKLCYEISISTVSAIIIYYIATYIPERRLIKYGYQFSSAELDKISSYCNKIIETVNMFSEYNCKVPTISREEAEKMVDSLPNNNEMKSIEFEEYSLKSSESTYKDSNLSQAVFFYYKLIHKEIEKIENILMTSDQELAVILKSIKDNNMFFMDNYLFKHKDETSKKKINLNNDSFKFTSREQFLNFIDSVNMLKKRLDELKKIK